MDSTRVISNIECNCGNCGNGEESVCYCCDGAEGTATEIIEGGWCKHWVENELTLDSGNFLE